MRSPLEKERRLLEMKYGGWSYENEIRIHATHEERDEETGLYFYPFGDRLVLREIIAGARFPFSEGLVKEALEGYPGAQDIKIVKARPSSSRFEIVVDEREFSK